MMRPFACLLLALVAAAEPPRPLPAGCTVRGRVRWVGQAPKVAALNVTKDQEACGKTAGNERLLIGPGGGVKHAVVWVDAIEDAPRAAPVTATVGQKACVLTPHVQVVPYGSRVEISNSDAVLHNVHAYLDGEGSLFSFAMPPGKGQKLTSRPLAVPGVVDLRCDAGHAWTSAWIHVAAHPWYTVTAADGSYTLLDVPPGDWVLRVWHEGWIMLGDDPPSFSEPVLLQREIQARTSTPTISDFDLRDF